MEEETCEKGYLRECHISPTLREFLSFAVETNIVGKSPSDILYYLEKPWKWEDVAKMWTEVGHPEPESALGLLVQDRSFGDELKIFSDYDYSSSLENEIRVYPEAINKFKEGATKLGMDQKRISTITNAAIKPSEPVKKGSKKP